jgi:flagellar biosynthesis/type III secretory pathway M-ring protein FliF/YscJ
VLDPPTPDQLLVVKNLVSGIVGLDTARGDQVIVQTLPFDVTLASEPPADLIALPPAVKPNTVPTGGVSGEPLWKQRQIQIIAGASLGAVLLLAGLVFVWKKRKKRGMTAGTATEAIERPQGSPGKQIPSGDPQELEKRAAEDAALTAQQEREVLAGIKLPDTTTKKGEVLKRHIRDEIKKSPDAIAHVVRTWLNAHNDE